MREREHWTTHLKPRQQLGKLICPTNRSVFTTMMQCYTHLHTLLIQYGNFKKLAGTHSGLEAIIQTYTSMCTCMPWGHAYIHIHTHTYIHTHIHTCVHTYTHTYVHTYTIYTVLQGMHVENLGVFADHKFRSQK